jgi:HK97 family phage major capsid protein
MPNELIEREDFKDFLVAQGGSVKVTPEGKVVGYLVRFSDENSPDVTGDFFTKETDFGVHKTIPTLYHHGMDLKIGGKSIGTGEATIDEEGIWFEAQLEQRDKYEKYILKLASMGKLGWSSGTAPHLVKRTKVGKAQKITAWPLGLDASLTPTPAEPRNMAMSMKSVEATDLDSQMEPEGGEPVPEQINNATEVKGNTIMEDKKEVTAEVPEVKAAPEMTVLNKIADEMKRQSEEAAKKAEADSALKAKIAEIVYATKQNAPIIDRAGPALNLKTKPGDDENKAFWYWMKTGDKGAYKTSYYESEAVEDEGGAVVPADFYNRIIAKRDIGSIVRMAGAEIYNTNRNVVNIPVEQTREGAPVVTAESQTSTQTSYSVNAVQTPLDLLPVTARKYTRLHLVSEEMLDDNQASFEKFLGDRIGRSFGLLENTLFLQGTNSGQPMGAMYSSTKGKDAAAASAVSAADVLGLYYSLTQPYRDGAAWVMRGATEGAIRALAGNNFSFGNTPSASVGATGLNTLVGNNRVFNTDEIVALSTSTKSILFGNFAFYTIVQRQSVTIKRLTERYAEVGQIGFLAAERVGGVITQAEAFMHLLNPSA